MNLTQEQILQFLGEKEVQLRALQLQNRELEKENEELKRQLQEQENRQQ